MTIFRGAPGHADLQIQYPRRPLRQRRHRHPRIGINNAGQIVGEYSDGSGIHGFLFSGGTYTTLNDPLAPNFTEALGINSAGQIVGDYVPGGGFLLTGGTYTTLNPPGSVSTIAEDINNKGQIVGSYYTSGSNYLTHGFIRLSDGSYLTYDDPYAGTSTLHNGTEITGVNDALAPSAATMTA